MNWVRLIAALITVESGGNEFAVGDGGAALGLLQIHAVCVEDVNRIYCLGPEAAFTHADAFVPEKARTICLLYLKHYAKGERFNSLAPEGMSREEFASRCWNGGPNGWKKAATKRYWAKVERALEEYDVEQRRRR